jgi:spermidine synthase
LSRRLEAVFLLFFASGFAGLIYESVWSHYLKLFLGHAAYAQTVVLVVFIGGLALGGWLCARVATRVRNPLRAYAWVEAAIGVIALVFHGVFIAATEWGYSTVLPATCDPGSTFCAAQWAIAALLLAPQSILLGATFPLVSSAVLRIESTQPGHHIASLYFLNSLGGVLGVLASAFLLIPAVGLPGTLRTAGALNIALALAATLLSRAPPLPLALAPLGHIAQARDNRQLIRFLLATACLTGLSSFIYEIVWIRMLSLVLGASTNAFELMLASFILGLAIGGYWIRERIDRLGDPVRFLAMVQIAMGVAALATVVLYNGSFDLMAWFLSAVSRNTGGFILFNVTSTFIALMVMLPATICAGMTLPLITYRLLRSSEGERSLGLVYSVNTAGAIIGVIAAVHLLIVWLGLHGTLVVGAGIDVALGLVLLRKFRGGAGHAAASYGHGGVASPTTGFRAVALGVAAFLALAMFTDIDLRRSSSGVFRTGAARIAPSVNVVYHRDGKTATIDVLDDGMDRAIRTNGKPDAAISMAAGRRPIGDEVTMMLLATLPLGHRPEATTAAVIGFGSGMSTTVLLSSPNLKRVDTIEIEPAIVEGAQRFRPVVEAAYTDPRSHIVIDDAKSYFARGRERYDIIVSEPSNPWVSGVASLFTEEFYRRLAVSLNDGGVMAQWLHTYEMDEATLASIFAAVKQTFPEFEVYSTIDSDVVLIARKGGPPGRFDAKVLQWPAIKANAERLKLADGDAIARRNLGNAASIDALFKPYGAPVNSDYFPIVDQKAARTRFIQARVTAMTDLQLSNLPLLEMLDGSFRPSSRRPDTYPWALADAASVTAWNLRDAALGERASADAPEFTDSFHLAAQMVGLWGSACPAGISFDEILPHLLSTAGASAQLPSPAAIDMWKRIGESACARRVSAANRVWFELFSAVAARDPDAMSASAEMLLDAMHGSPSAASEYAFLAAVLGHACRGRTQAADKLFGQATHDWIRPAQHSVELRYLYRLSHETAARNAKGEGCVTAVRY